MTHFHCFDNIHQYRKRVPVIMSNLNLDIEHRSIKRDKGLNKRSNDLSVGAESYLYNDLDSNYFLMEQTEEPYVFFMPEDLGYFLAMSLKEFNVKRGLV